jgi:uncharacterized membrane protein YgdD (TMEM256/DUF423 family)
MDKKIILAASFFGMTAIILGAFGAHALKKILTIDQLATFETGVKYQMYHALFLLFVGMYSEITLKVKKTILWVTAFGILFFSGSIYLLATMDVTGINFKTIGFITPIGGLFLISAWILLGISVVKKKDKS